MRRMLISFKLVLLMFLPLLVGVLTTLVLSHLTLRNSLLNWYDQSERWLQEIDKDKLHNSVLANKVIIEIHLRGISEDLSVMEALYKRIYQVSNDTEWVACSTREYDEQTCEEYKMKLQKENFIYLDQWFHRDYSSLSKLSAVDLNYLSTTLRFMFYPKAVYSIRNTSLVSVTRISQTFNTSLLVATPSRLQNYNQSERETCIDDQGVENFDPRCRCWFQETLNSTGIELTEPFISQATKQVVLLESRRILDDSNNFLAVHALNLGFDNLKEKVFSAQDSIQDKGLDPGGYNVLFHAKNALVYHHKDWSPLSGQTAKWIDLEYSNSTSEWNASEKEEFQQHLSSMLSSETGVLDSPNEGKHNPIVIGRVVRDMHTVILDTSFSFFALHLKLSIAGFVFIAIVIVVAIMHLSAVLRQSVDLPMDLLCKFLEWQDWNLIDLQDKLHEYNQSDFLLSDTDYNHTNPLIAGSENTTQRSPTMLLLRNSKKHIQATSDKAVVTTAAHVPGGRTSISTSLIIKNLTNKQIVLPVEEEGFNDIQSNQGTTTNTYAKRFSRSPSNFNTFHLNNNNNNNDDVDFSQQFFNPITQVKQSNQDTFSRTHKRVLSIHGYPQDSTGKTSNKLQKINRSQQQQQQQQQQPQEFLRNISIGISPDFVIANKCECNNKQHINPANKNERTEGEQNTAEIFKTTGSEIGFTKEQEQIIIMNSHQNYVGAGGIEIETIEEESAISSYCNFHLSNSKQARIGGRNSSRNNRSRKPPRLVELKDIRCSFTEMSIIVSVFQKMENVIKLAKVCEIKGQSDSSLLQYSNLVSMFNISDNLLGMSACYTNIGILLLRKAAFADAANAFTIAVHFSLRSWFHVHSYEEFRFLYQQIGTIDLSEDVCMKISYRFRLLSLAYLLQARLIDHTTNFRNNKCRQDYFESTNAGDEEVKQNLLLKAFEHAKHANELLNGTDRRQNTVKSIVRASVSITGTPTPCTNGIAAQNNRISQYIVERKINRCLLVEISLELGEVAYAKGIMEEISKHLTKRYLQSTNNVATTPSENLKAVAAYYKYLLAKIFMHENKLHSATVLLTETIKSSALYDAYLIKHSHELLSEIMENQIRRILLSKQAIPSGLQAESALIQRELACFDDIKPFEFYFVMNVSDGANINAQVATVEAIRENFSTANNSNSSNNINDEDTFAFFVYDCYGVERGEEGVVALTARNAPIRFAKYFAICIKQIVEECARNSRSKYEIKNSTILTTTTAATQNTHDIFTSSDSSIHSQQQLFLQILKKVNQFSSLKEINRKYAYSRGNSQQQQQQQQQQQFISNKQPSKMNAKYFESKVQNEYTKPMPNSSIVGSTQKVIVVFCGSESAPIDYEALQVISKVQKHEKVRIVRMLLESMEQSTFQYYPQVSQFFPSKSRAQQHSIGSNHNNNNNAHVRIYAQEQSQQLLSPSLSQQVMYSTGEFRTFYSSTQVLAYLARKRQKTQQFSNLFLA